MENQETSDRHRDEFYKKELRLDEGIELGELISGKGTTFTIKEDELNEDIVSDVRKFHEWDKSEISTVGIDPSAHEGGAFKGIEHLFKDIIAEDGVAEQRILKQTVKPGSGPLVPSRAWVKIHYSSYVEGHDEPTDSTRLRNRPHAFILGEGVNIAAIDLAVSTMKKKEKSRFLADYNFCYGIMGVPPRVPKKARILFDIEVVHFLDEDKIHEYDALAPDDKRDIPLDGVLKLAGICREKGNENYAKSIKIAYNSYYKGYRILDGYSPSNDTEETQLQSEKIKILLNLSQSCLEQSKTIDCRRYADEAAQYLKNEALKNPLKLAKAHYIIHKSYIKENKLKNAQKALEDAVRSAPEDATIREAFVKLEKAQARENALERETMTKMGDKLWPQS